MTWKDIPGWWDDEWLFRDIVRAAPDPAVFVEVGSWMGRSAACMASLIRDSGRDIVLDCVDTWQGSEYGSHPGIVAKLNADGKTLHGEFVHNLWKLGLIDYITAIKLPSVDAAATYEDGSLHCVFIDADHRADSVKADCLAWLPKIEPGGIICGHDWPVNDKAPQGVKRGVLAAGLNPSSKGMVWWQRV